MKMKWSILDKIKIFYLYLKDILSDIFLLSQAHSGTEHNEYN